VIFIFEGTQKSGQVVPVPVDPIITITVRSTIPFDEVESFR